MSNLDDLKNRLLTYYVETHVYCSAKQTFTNIEYESYEPYYNYRDIDLVANKIHETILSLQVF